MKYSCRYRIMPVLIVLTAVTCGCEVNPPAEPTSSTTIVHDKTPAGPNVTVTPPAVNVTPPTHTETNTTTVTPPTGSTSSTTTQTSTTTTG